MPTDEHDLGVAEATAMLWGEVAAPVRLVHRRENSVFEVAFRDGRRGALRLHRKGYQSPERVEAELVWTEALADAAFPCPWPQRTRDGSLTARATDGRTASIVQWLDGVPLAASPPDETAFHMLGALLADLHLTSDAVAPATLDRPRWDVPAFCDPNRPRWGKYWENPALNPQEKNLLLAAREALAERLHMPEGGAFGLIHADVLPDNVLVSGRHAFLIDFDDGGYGDRRYDLATALVQYIDHPAFEIFEAAVIKGYCGAGGPAAPVTRNAVRLLIACRALASCGWSATRLAQEDPRQKIYADRAVSCVTRMFQLGHRATDKKRL